MEFENSVYSYPTLAQIITKTDITLREILDTYREDNDLLKLILVAKAQEDKATEEEKCKAERFRLQHRQVDLEISSAAITTNQRPSLTLSIPSFPTISSSPTVTNNHQSFSIPNSGIEYSHHSASPLNHHHYLQSPNSAISNKRTDNNNEVDHEYVMEALRAKITIKTLKQDQFQLDVELEDTVLNIKEKIQEIKEYDIPTQKLIYSAESNPASDASQMSELFNNPNALVTGADYEKSVQYMMEMGFDRESAVSAMRASFNNPNRAVEYLMTGIPENFDNTPGVTNPTSTNSAPNLTQNLQQQRQRATQGGGGGGGQGGGNMDDLNFLRNQPHFRNLRQFVQQNPSLLQPLLQQIGAQNPELLQLINSNQATFMRLLQEPDEGGEGNLPPPQYVSVTQEEKEAIDRLEALGFDRALAIEAYLACDKNEEMAANYLFDHMNDEEKKK
ncbi:13049_t:CDS:10 [Entrophospora sp. SA101]|nr:3916_t:CDS:10 [Entrophospora sp. SA101]CAJ0864838.1 3923_t:CDS:10 [Entrophospora sp. SA101]CAJ0864878.1 3927_t:CDS:10 [Entrophospora sp. SA101]CAJ0926061.1 13049_t:CDS:10 [Entrophospora sp. SA101]